MSAAATAAGYLYASGRLRGRGTRDEHEKQPETPRKRKEIRVAAYRGEEAPPPAVEAPKPKRTPKIEYRTRRWKPDEQA